MPRAPPRFSTVRNMWLSTQRVLELHPTSLPETSHICSRSFCHSCSEPNGLGSEGLRHKAVLRTWYRTSFGKFATRFHTPASGSRDWIPLEMILRCWMRCNLEQVLLQPSRSCTRWRPITLMSSENLERLKSAVILIVECLTSEQARYL